VPRLRRIAEALARGHRAGEVLTAADADLETLLQATPGPGAPARTPTPIDSAEAVAPLLLAVQTFDGERLTRLLLAEWGRLGPLGFLESCAGPLVQAIGEAWATGSAEVRHEHFLSERLSDVLRTLRRPYEERAEGPLVAFATLPGEAHGLGLQMAALAVATTGCRILYLGTDVPVDQITRAASDIGARAVALSVSASSAGEAARGPLAALRDALPRRVRLVVGGRGAPRDVDAVDVVSGFDELQHWAAQLASH
jgi:methanogenic corrinoid protein MtbC1